jgi:tetratricopeptide (TPR) repeat protein
VRRYLAVAVVVLCTGLPSAKAAAETPAEAPPQGPVVEAASLELVGPKPAPAGLDPAASELPERDPVRAALWRAWSLPSRDLAERVRRTERAGLALGLGSLEGPARALLIEPGFGPAAERAELAAAIAPELPATHAALAAARFDAWQLVSAWRSFREALDVALQHLEGRLWLEATGSDALFGAAFGSALGFLALAAVGSFPRFARDLRALRELPAPSAGALAASIVLLPAALGEGLAGVGLGLAAFALVNGSGWRRLQVTAAAALLVISLHPLLELRAASQAALAVDEVALAAWATEQGTPNASELARVLRHADSDPLASRALALRLARQGELALAEQRFAGLLAEHAEPDLLANAAAVRLQRGDVDGAIALYEKAASASDSAVVRFNLAQALGRAIRLDEQELALAEAQSIDRDVLVELNHRYDGKDGALVAYLPLRAAALKERLTDHTATPYLASALRRPLAPGSLGASRAEAVVALAVALASGLLLGAALRRIAGPDEDLYAGIARLLQTRGGDSMARMAQIEELRARQARNERLATLAAWLVPGAAGLTGGRPLLGFLGVALFASGASLWIHRHGAVADPLALGALPAALVGVGLALLGAAYLLVLGLAFALREKD